MVNARCEVRGSGGVASGVDRLAFEPVGGRNAVVHWACNEENHDCCGASWGMQAPHAPICSHAEKTGAEISPGAQ
jgi:hypothetical protein